MPLISSIGFGGIAGFLVGFAIKKIMKILAIIAGVFFAALIYLQSQGIVNMNWDKLQAVSQNIISALTSAVTTTTTTAGGGVSIPSISNTTASTILPTTWIPTMASFGIPLTGSAAMGFTIGFMKG
jgi:uncharacterized membrane protein (Fun14 family)